MNETFRDEGTYDALLRLTNVDYPHVIFIPTKRRKIVTDVLGYHEEIPLENDLSLDTIQFGQTTGFLKHCKDGEWKFVTVEFNPSKNIEYEITMTIYNRVIVIDDHIYALNLTLEEREKRYYPFPVTAHLQIEKKLKNRQILYALLCLFPVLWDIVFEYYL